MQLKEFLELIRMDEIITLYSPTNNCYLQMEKYKENIDKGYLNCKVIGINTNSDSYGNAVLEIDIVNI